MWRLVFLSAAYAFGVTTIVAGALFLRAWLRLEIAERRRHRPHLRIIRQTHPPRSHVRMLP